LDIMENGEVGRFMCYLLAETAARV
jgi:hypothetical protein